MPTTRQRMPFTGNRPPGGRTLGRPVWTPAGAPAPPPIPRLPLPPPATGAGGLPVLAKSGPAAALALSFAGGLAIGSLLWGYLNQRQGAAPPERDPFGPWGSWPVGDGEAEGTPDEPLRYGFFEGLNLVGPPQTGPGTEWRFYPTGQASTTGPNVWRVGPGSWEQWTNLPDGSWAWQTRSTFERVYVRGPYDGTSIFAKLRDWTTLPENAAGYGTAGIYDSTGAPLTFFTGGGGHRNLRMPTTVQPLNTPADVEFGPGPLPPAEPDPFRRPSPAPEIAPAAPAPLPLVLPPVPQPTPGPVPGADPVAPGSTPGRRPTAVPAATPRRSPRPLPLLPQQPTREPRRILPDGRPAPDPEAPPRVTDPEVITVPGGAIGQPGARPRADLESMARELGRIEQKMEISLSLQTGDNQAPPRDPLLEQIGQELLSPYPGGEFLLFPVCETDADGTPLPPREAPWPGGAGALALLSAKIDALAELLQHSKELRQPICRQKPIGREVTVTFEEVP